MQVHLWRLFDLSALVADAGARLDGWTGVGLGLLLLWAAWLWRKGRLSAGAMGLVLGAGAVVVTADNLLVLGMGWTWLCAAPLLRDEAAGWRRGRPVLSASGVLGVVLGTGLLFFGLGGSWSTRGKGYLPDAVVTQAAASAEAASAEAASAEVGVAGGAAAAGPRGPTLRFAELTPDRAEGLLGKLLYGLPLLHVIAGLFLLGVGGLLSQIALPAAGSGVLRLHQGAALLSGLTLLYRLRPVFALLLRGLAVLAVLLCSQPALAAPRLSASPPALEFLPQGGARSVRLSNTGDEPLHITFVGFSADATGFALSGAGPALPRALLPGESLDLEVAYLADGKRRQAFGGLQIRSDDPQGADDPRTEEADHIHGVALSAGSSPLLSALWGAPLLGGLLLLGLWRRSQAAQLLAAVGGLIPLGLLLWVAAGPGAGFDRALSVQKGNYGMQWLTHRVAWGGLEYHLGVDGLAVSLLLLLAGLLPVALWRAGAAQRGGLLVLCAGLFGALCSLDVVGLAVALQVLLLGAWLTLGPGRRRPLILGQAGVGLVVAWLWVLSRRSIATTRIDGTPVLHTLDLVRLMYHNHFDGAVLGLPLDLAAWVGMLAGLLLLCGSLSWAARRRPAGVLLIGGMPALLLYGVLRLLHGLVPDAAAWGATGLGAAGAALCLMAAVRLLSSGGPPRERALRALTPMHLGACLLGAGSGTQAGLQGVLLLLWCHGLVYAALSEGGGGGLRGVAWAAGVGLPGTGTFLGLWLILIGSLPSLRGLTAVMTAALLLGAGGLLQQLRKGRAEPAPGPAGLGPGGLVLSALLLGLGVYPGPLMRLQGTAVNDLLSHTSGHVGPGAVSLLQLR